MNPVEMLKDDHRNVEQLFSQYRQASDDHDKQQLADTILKEIEVHSKLEEQVFYPAVHNKAEGQLQQVLRHSQEEHAAVDQLIAELKAIGSLDARFEATFQQLMQKVQEHVQDEELRMLPEAQTRLGSDADSLAQQMQQKKQELLGAAR